MNKISTYRKQLGLSQRQLATHLGWIQWFQHTAGTPSTGSAASSGRANPGTTDDGRIQTA